MAQTEPQPHHHGDAQKVSPRSARGSLAERVEDPKLAPDRLYTSPFSINSLMMITHITHIGARN